MRPFGLDVGRKASKLYSEGIRDIFLSYVGTYRPLRLERQLTDDDMIVEYGGKAYYVGAIARDESYDGVQSFLTTKAHFDTKLLGLVALHRNVQDGEEISIVTGHPVENHVDPEKERMRQLYHGSHDLTVNAVRKRFMVSSVSITAEGAATMFLLPKRPMAAHGIDGGSSTTNFVTWQRGAWVDRLSGTLPYGFENIQNLGLEQYARMIAYDVTKHINSYRGIVYTVGGRAEELAKALQEFLPVPVKAIDDGLFANARAYYELGVRMRGEKIPAK